MGQVDNVKRIIEPFSKVGYFTFSEACGGTLTASTSEQEIMSPGYNGRGHYLDKTECNWHIQAPRGYKIQMRFEGNFGVYCHYHQQCFHWVEVKYAGNLDEPGPRFCCYSTPRNGTHLPIVIPFSCFLCLIIDIKLPELILSILLELKRT